MYQVGIDIGSSAAKTAVIKDGEVVKTYLLNTGFSSRKTAEDIYQMVRKEWDGHRHRRPGYQGDRLEKRPCHEVHHER